MRANAACFKNFSEFLVYVYKNGSRAATVTVESTTTIDQFISTMRSNGFDASLVNGKLTLNGNENLYCMSGGLSLKSIFKLDKDNSGLCNEELFI